MNFFKRNDVGSIIGELKQRVLDIPLWSTLLSEYEPMLHEIVEDHVGRQDRTLDDGIVEKAARLPIGLEKLLTRRISEFTMAIPVKRVYTYDQADEELKTIVRAIEKIYTCAHIDAVNMHRAKCYYASCQMFTLWYTQKKPNKLYGSNSQYKLKCKTFSPMDGVDIYPYFDEYDDCLLCHSSISVRLLTQSTPSSRPIPQTIITSGTCLQTTKSPDGIWWMIMRFLSTRFQPCSGTGTSHAGKD